MSGAKEKEFVIKSSRSCPRCRINLYKVERGGETLDICQQCNGIFFDTSELDELMGKESAVELLILITDELKGESLPCPHCDRAMVTKEVYGVYMDYCKDCLGIWMDPGETGKVWKMDELSKHPFDREMEDMDPKQVWSRFKVKYYGFEKKP